MLSKSARALYGLALALATPVAADVALDGALPGMVALAPSAPSATGFARPDGRRGDLSDHAGEVVVLNFWATWCAPCKEEMPSLQALQDALGDEGLEVVTIAFGRHNPVAMERFWEDTGVTTLPLNLDADTTLARGFGVRGLPHTIVLDREGRAIAELVGEADWASADALDVMRALIAR